MGIVEEEDYIILYTKEGSLCNEKWISERLNILISENLLEDFSVKSEMLKNKNWNEEWERNVKIVKISDRLVIKPSFREYEPEKNEHIIIIDPKMSFGTGDHQTTKLASLLLEKNINGGESVLDVGSGTGILSLAAYKFGAERVLGIDNDEWCFLNGKENVALNSAESTVEIKQHEITDIMNEKFDLIIANINKSVLLEIASDIAERLKKSGKVILSGICHKDIKDIKAKYEKEKLILYEKSQEDEWAALIFNRQRH